MKSILLFAIIALASLSLYASTPKPLRVVFQNETTSSETDAPTTSRFILADDPHCDTIAGIPIPQNWWSRHQEYKWAAQFAGPEYVVLDAACGISHPFKWYLGPSSVASSLRSR